MCVTILKNNQNISYDAGIPLDKQISKNDQLFIDYKANCSDVDLLLKEIDRLRFAGEMPECDIKVNYNNNLCGFKLYKQVAKIKNDISISEVIKLMVISYQSIDRKFEDILNTCSKSKK